MKKKTLLLLSLFLGVTLHAQQQRQRGAAPKFPAEPHRSFLNNLSHYIDNPALFQLGQEVPRAYHIPAESISLNGKWKFFWCDTPDGIPANFFAPNYPDKKWAHIDVPSNWEMQGYGDKLFRNVATPFPANPPHPPADYNPTGLYRRTFKIPADWKADKQIFLRFEKVASASFVWINGQEVGYNEGAQEPSEYNITPYLKPGENTLAVCVLKYSDGYYLEGQDYWRLAGIFDDVWLYAAPNIRIFDWQVITDFDDTYTDAEVDVRVKIKDYKGAGTKGYQLKASLINKDTGKAEEFGGKVLNNTASIETWRRHLAGPLKWTSETPHLYTLQLDLLTADGALQDRIQTTIGFKKTEIRDGVFYLNGVPLKVNAQNSHMQHPELGHVMDEATIRKDFELLKQFNFNAVRTSHYPPVNKYLELANEYGLYVIDEVGDEAHATEWISNRPEYEPMYRDRVRKMVLRDRNYPCILFWSAGNESGEGENITHVIDEGKSLDHTRYWMYGGNAYSHPAEDIIGPRYPTPMELEIQVGLGRDNDTRPSFMDEYLSVAGNGGGALDDYWNVIYRHPRIIGGAIWDFVSPGLTEEIRQVEDSSPYRTPAHLMGNARLVKDKNNTILDLNGHDQWVEVYRSDNVEISGDALTLTFKAYPRKLISSCGSFITKGSHQFGVQQHGKESLEFYIYTDKKHSIYAPLPDNWEYNWHQVTAVYNGSEMALYINNEKKANANVSGNIRNFPFPINIGRNAEAHGQETNVYICDAQMDDVGVFDKDVVSDFRAEDAKLWLNFDNETNNGNFFSYGIGARTYGSIWPDRTVQPEMWQMKKTVQPLSFSMVDAEAGLLEVWNRNHFTDASQYDIRWELLEDDKVIQSGTLELNTAPLSRERVEIPYKQPAMNSGKEYRIIVRSFLKKDELWASAGHEVAWDEFPLSSSLRGLARSNPGNLAVTNESNSLIVSGTNFRYTFNDGLLTSLIYKGKEMLKSPLRLNLWRAPLANELDNWNAWNAAMPYWKEGYGNTLATEMYSTGIDTRQRHLTAFTAEEVNGRVHINVTSAELMGADGKEKKDLYIEGVQCNGILNTYQYIIHGDGTIEITHNLKPEGKMPLWLPRVGLTLTVNDALSNVEWYGRGPQENYPDRKTGYRTGIYTNTVDGMFEPYLMPQDYGLRTDTRWLRLTDDNGIGLQFEMNELFNFNAYPYSTDNLTKAMYTYQLLKQDGITVNLDYATTGVGCTARGVFPSYRAQVREYDRKIIIKPIQ
ncbi:glycoside hydrolase family 2 TIM barrel-domain containing protein [Bacteroides sp. 51]|uniref:glycoside hydrolase family 2 TIM barrel-domain containing protein n=1 Tax=Bacteroides sp. 51 TaxID=2302938 RepID=UPI0013D6E061|nr:glycoside hydrolase family 2 TIM barrel-domain containing protein [Bacteroides sp. 51]NDV84638.1 DUF4981 domain-containing protein [Bacteroides sp. 51]